MHQLTSYGVKVIQGELLSNLGQLDEAPCFGPETDQTSQPGVVLDTGSDAMRPLSGRGRSPRAYAPRLPH
jgi:hypothetical protein